MAREETFVRPLTEALIERNQRMDEIAEKPHETDDD